MRRIYFLFAIFQALWGYSVAQSSSFSLLREEFDSSQVLKDYFFGFSLYDLDSNQFLLGVNQDKNFAPASNTKVFTLISALNTLGDSIPGIHYIEEGDSLIFWGTGDPTLLHKNLDTRVVFDFLQSNTRSLYFAVDTPSQEPFYRNGWSIEDYEEYYQPEISPFPIFGNVVTFKETGGHLTAYPNMFQGKLFLNENNTVNYLHVNRDFASNNFYYNTKAIPKNYTIEKPFRYSAKLAIDLLSDTLKRQVKLISRPRPKTGLKTVYSARTVDVLREMMLPSDNFLAEQFQMLSAQALYGTFQTQTLRAYMNEKYYAQFQDKIQLFDGSGLSTYNKVTPRSIVEALLMVHAQTENRNQLEFLFPTGGVNGTLKTAYKLDNGQAFVWAKTGTINGVHNQSGYIRTRSGRNLAFSFLNTNYLGSPAPVRKEIVRLITFIRKHY